MNSLLYLLVAISAMSSQLSTRPFCNGPGCQSNQPSAATWSQSSNRTMESRRSSLLVDRRDSVKCPCRTCDPRFPCSPENCGRQDCPDCVNACQNCSPDQSASQVNDGWEPRRTDLRGRKPFSQTSVQRICPVTGEELGSMGRPIPSKSPDEQFRSAVRHALPKCNGILKNICGASLTKSEPGPSTFLANRETLVSPICSRILSDCVLSLAKNLDPWVRRFRSQFPDEQFTFAAKPVLPL